MLKTSAVVFVFKLQKRCAFQTSGPSPAICVISVSETQPSKVALKRHSRAFLRQHPLHGPVLRHLRVLQTRPAGLGPWRKRLSLGRFGTTSAIGRVAFLQAFVRLLLT